MGMGVGVTVGVAVASGVDVTLGVIVQPGGMVGSSGRTEQAANAMTMISPKRVRMDFIPFLYWQKRGKSSKVIIKETRLDSFRRAVIDRVVSDSHEL
jgi:hypothetical protein